MFDSDITKETDNLCHFMNYFGKIRNSTLLFGKGIFRQLDVRDVQYSLSYVTFLPISYLLSIFYVPNSVLDPQPHCLSPTHFIVFSNFRRWRFRV